jgi:phosphodiesterase/alkaline phosphatase D-like protein
LGSELSRRRFLTLGAAIAGAALVPMEVGAAAASVPQKHPKGTAAGGRFPYALASWQEIGSAPVRIDLPRGRSTKLRVQKATDLAQPSRPSAHGDEFSLTFSVDGAVPSEGTYTLNHSSLGTFPLFLSPTDNGRVTALVNRSHGVHHR